VAQWCAPDRRRDLRIDVTSSGTPGAPSARRVAFDVLRRIERDGAFANLVLGPALAASSLSAVDRRFATELVYGTTRMRRACDVLADRFVTTAPDDVTRTALRLGAYQLAFMGVPPHAAVDETVSLTPRRTRGFVNAVLRKIAASPIEETAWPSEAARLSYPTWIVDRLRTEVGDEWLPALERMNQPPPVTARADGYVQDESSQWVAVAVGVEAGERLYDACAAPGGKATAMATTAPTDATDAMAPVIVAADRRLARARLVRSNALRLDLRVPTIVADSTAPPFASGSFDAVLVDAPCSGLGALRRRPDARWRIEPADLVRLVDLQRRLIVAGAALVRPGGRLVYSVCTLTAVESIDHRTPDGFEIDPAPPAVGRWRAYGQGWRVLPHDADTDGMVLVRYRRTQ
jgi:16S rRNA (cytosine967-C5)-methyltransferase